MDNNDVYRLAAIEWAAKLRTPLLLLGDLQDQQLEKDSSVMVSLWVRPSGYAGNAEPSTVSADRPR